MAQELRAPFQSEGAIIFSFCALSVRSVEPFGNAGHVRVNQS